MILRYDPVFEGLFDPEDTWSENIVIAAEYIEDNPAKYDDTYGLEGCLLYTSPSPRDRQ